MGKKNHNSHHQKAKNGREHVPNGNKKLTNVKSSLDVKNIGITIFLFLTATWLYYQHTTRLFESDKHFSHLSNLERELSFRTEMGLYYSYYKTLIEAPTFFSGIVEITNDNITEYPKVINTLQRFNLYPEVMTAFLYRNFRTVTDSLKIKTTQCWQTNRGNGLSAVLSCEGWGDPMYFYIGTVYLLNGLMMGVFYLFGSWLAESHLGGILAVAAHFFNHGECTRVQWTPALRESFAHPFIILQMFIISTLMRRKHPSNCLMIMSGLVSLIFILFWQFAPFALTTQIIAVTSVYAIDLLNRDVFDSFIKGQIIALISSFILLFGNRMVICSLMTSSLIAAFLLVNTEPIIKRIKTKQIRWIVCMIHFLLMTICIKVLLTKIMKVDEDAHITDLLKSKFTDFSTFHTKLYTCAVEFDFLQTSTYWNLLYSGLLPIAVLVVVITLSKVFKYAFLSGEVDAAILYNVVQLFAFTVMAVLIMRLKAFWTPQMCLIAGLLASKRIIPLKTDMFRQALVGVALASMCVQGWTNLNQQWSVKGEFSHPQMEELMDWINKTTTPDSVFAGSMPLMATIKLTTKRPIVNHPHYEDAELRERTKKVYTIFSRKPLREVYEHVVDLKVDFLIVDKNWCTARSSAGCSMPEIWDLEDPENSGNNPACLEINDNPKPYFTPVKTNTQYRVFKVNKFPTANDK